MSTLQRQAGHLLTIGFEGRECGSELKDLLQSVQPGGVIFFQRNIVDEDQFHSLASGVQESLGNTLRFLAIDQEGGEVDRFRELLGPLPSARDAARSGLSRELGDLVGRELAAFGIDVDFAPVLDLGLPQSREVLGSRSAGDTPQEVVRFAERFLLGLTGCTGWNVLGCLKHFPGLGAGRSDSHIGMPVIEKDAEELWREDLQPFRVLAGAGHLVMVAHAWYPDLERSLSAESQSASQPTPASLSHNIVTGLLRRKIGYRSAGVVCDDLEMGGALQGRSIEEAAVEAVRAGCDILLVCRHAANVVRVHAALVREAERDSEFRTMLRKAQTGSGMRTQPANFANLDVLRRDIRTFGEEVRRKLAMLENAPDSQQVER